MPVLLGLIRKNRTFCLIIVALGAAGAIFTLDVYAPLGASAGVLYVCVILLGWWLKRNRYIFGFATLSSALIFLALYLSKNPGIDAIGLTHLALELSAIWIVAGLLSIARRAITRNQQSMVELQQSVAIRGEIEKRLQASHQQLEQRIQERTKQLEDEIAERKLAQGELERFKTTLDQTQDCVFIFDVESLKFTYFNRGALEQVGYSEAEMLQMTPLDIKPLFTTSSFEALLASLREGTEASHIFETLHRHKTGRDIPVEIVLQLIAPADEEPRFVAIVRDLTDRREAEASLQEGQLKYRQLIEGSIQGIAIIQNLELKFANQSLAEIYGYPAPEPLLGKNTLDLFIAPHERERIQQLHRARMRGEPVVERYEFQGVRIDGALIWLEGLAKTVEWEGQPAVLVTYIDITERKALEAQLLQAQKMEAIGQLAGGVAHEFNNLLQVIQGYVELAVHQKDVPPIVVQHLNVVHNATDRAAGLTRQLLTFGRKTALNFGWLDIGGLIQNQLSLLRQFLGEKFEISFENKLVGATINGDAGMLEQVLLNLCINARDAMPDGGQIKILAESLRGDRTFRGLHEWAEAETYCLISVRDTGHGMTTEVSQHVFEPFFTTKDVGKGSGLGLSVAYGIIQQHGGRIEVSSQPGKGTTFQIYLPLSEQTEHPLVTADEPSASRGDETILVVEDEQEVLKLVSAILESQGYTVHTAISGEEGLALLNAEGQNIDLALIDLVMPKMSGWEMFQKLRPRHPDLPVIFCTGYDADSLDKKYVSEHNIRILQKPYRTEHLFHAVRDVIDAPPKILS